MGTVGQKSHIMLITLIATVICLATASSANANDRETKQFWPITPQSLPLTYHKCHGYYHDCLPQFRYPIHYPSGLGGGLRSIKLRSKVTGTLKSKTVTPAVKKFKLHQRKNTPAIYSKEWEQAFWFLDKNGDDELSRNEFMGLALMAEDYVDPADVLEIMRFTDQNYDNAIQHWEFIEAMEYFNEQNELDYDY